MTMHRTWRPFIVRLHETQRTTHHRPAFTYRTGTSSGFATETLESAIVRASLARNDRLANRDRAAAKAAETGADPSFVAFLYAADVEIEIYMACPTCHATGIQPGTKRKRCATCTVTPACGKPYAIGSVPIPYVPLDPWPL